MRGGGRPHNVRCGQCAELEPRQQLSPDTLTTRTPEANAWARAQFAQVRSAGPFKPLTVGTDTTIYPGFDGGAEWGGPAWDAATGLLYVNANENGVAGFARGE